MRSRARLRKPGSLLVDPSLGPRGTQRRPSAELICRPCSGGVPLPGLVVRDLRVYAQRLRGVVDSWRDSNGNEVDAIVTGRDGWRAFEIKLNPAAVDDAAACAAPVRRQRRYRGPRRTQVLGVVDQHRVCRTSRGRRLRHSDLHSGAVVVAGHREVEAVQDA